MKRIVLLSAMLLAGLHFLQAQAPVNDACTGAIRLNNLAAGASVTFNNTQANYSINASCEGVVGIVNNPDVWYDFVMPFDGNVIVESELSGLIFGLFGSACGSIVAGGSIQCDAGRRTTFAGLNAGQTYRLKLGTNITDVGTYEVFVRAVPTAANNTCNTPTLVNTDLLVEQELTFNNEGATETATPSCELSSTDYLDVWYRITMPVSGNLVFTNTPDFISIAMYSACGAQEVRCGLGNQVFSGLVGGQQYRIRLATPKRDAGQHLFTIQAVASAPNDECANRTVWDNTVLQSGIDVVANLKAATESTNSTCETAAEQNLDLWYGFTMPYDGNLTLSSNTGLPQKFTLYQTCGGAQISCVNTNTTFTGLLSGVSYVLRMSNVLDNAGFNDFRAQIAASPANDDCASPLVLTGDLAAGIAVPFDNTNATTTAGISCQILNPDLWYQFTMPFTGNVQIDGSIHITAGVYSSCGSAPAVCPNSSNKLLSGLIGGQTYLLRLSTGSSTKGSYALTMRAYPAAANDDCTTATNITADLSVPVVVSTDFRTATAGVSTSCEGSTVYYDLWYKFTMPFNGQLRMSKTTAPQLSVALYDACGAAATACKLTSNFTPGEHFTRTLTGGQTYWLRVAVTSAYILNHTVTLQAFQELPQATCSNAMSVPVTPNCTGTPNVVDTRSAPLATMPATCAGTGDVQGVWYKFVAPANGAITISSSTDSNYFALYEACATSPLQCATKDMTIANTEFGKTYYLYAFRTANKSGVMSFCISGSAFIIADPANALCQAATAVSITIGNGNTNKWVPLLNANGQIMGAVNANGQVLGSVTASVRVGQLLIRRHVVGNLPYLRREVTISTANTFTQPVSVRLFFKEDEYNDLLAAGGLPAGLGGFGVYKEASTTCTNGYMGTGSYIPTITSSYGNGNFVSEFAVSGFSTFFPSTSIEVLPVSLGSFTGRSIAGANELQWTTLQEQQTSHFDVERSADGGVWQTIGVVKAKGNSSSATTYSFIDQHPNKQTLYRLKMMDKDGQFTYSPVVSISVVTGTAAVQVYPNPAHKWVYVKAPAGTYDVVFVNQQGQQIRRINAVQLQPSGTSLSIQDLPKGMYLLQLIANNQQAAAVHTKLWVQ